jgi:dTMP kinase
MTQLAVRWPRYGATVTRGQLISIEGLDGAGKTTLAGALAAALERRGVLVELLREPGGVAASERVRDLVKDPALRVGPRAEALLYAAARAQLVEERLLPALSGGTWVVLDRFTDSSLAYQGGGRGLGVDHVRAINQFATGGLTPDRTLLLRVDPHTGGERQRVRAQAPDRLEREDRGFFEAIAAAYDELARAEPERFRVIDAAAPAEQVLADALDAIEDLVAAAASPASESGPVSQAAGGRA